MEKVILVVKEGVVDGVAVVVDGVVVVVVVDVRCCWDW